MEIKEIRTLIDLMKKNGLTVFQMERGDFKITLKTAEAGGVVMAPGPSIPPPAAAPVATEVPVAVMASAPEPSLREIKAPMVGTFYVAPSPDAPPFVTPGQVVTPDTVVCIIEAMKVMNEIKAEVSGTIVEVCVENGKPVQFGQALFRIK